MYNNTKLLTCFCSHMFDVNRVDTQEAVLFYVSHCCFRTLLIFCLSRSWLRVYVAQCIVLSCYSSSLVGSPFHHEYSVDMFC